MKLDLSGLSDDERAEIEARVEVLRTHARPGVRVALVCPVAECNYRYFGNPAWMCPEHGRAEAQENKPYMGVSTV